MFSVFGRVEYGGISSKLPWTCRAAAIWPLSKMRRVLAVLGIVLFHQAGWLFSLPPLRATSSLAACWNAVINPLKTVENISTQRIQDILIHICKHYKHLLVLITCT